jgi:hypothetical protein
MSRGIFFSTGKLVGGGLSEWGGEGVFLTYGFEQGSGPTSSRQLHTHTHLVSGSEGAV